MNAILNIQVRVVSADAMSRLKGLQGQLRSLDNTGGSAGNRAAQGFSKMMNSMTAMGKNLQWTGRQLEYNFTLPIVLAGTAAGKWANDVQAAQTKVIKVYGNLNTTQAEATTAVNHLQRAFVALSNIFGVHQKDVTEIAALWASAGAQGVELARATRLTIQTMVLGELEQADAVKALLTIQGAYRLNVDQLSTALDTLNVVENETAITLSGLIDVVTRAGGVAATAGIDIAHLAAMAASLVPATGSAATAGNSLKTIISRLLVPTKQAAEIMGLMGIEVNSTSWQMKNGTQRIEEMAKRFSTLSDAQQVQVSSLVGTRFQINRFDVLMKDVVNTQGNYQKALRDTASSEKNHQVTLRELNTVLSSSPQAWKILTTRMQNALVQVMIPIMPALLSITSHIVGLVDAFSKLNPQTQQWVVIGLMALAMIGPLAKYMGAFQTLAGIFNNSLTRGLTRALFFNAGAIEANSSAMKVFLGTLGQFLLFPIKAVAAIWRFFWTKVLFDEGAQTFRGLATIEAAWATISSAITTAWARFKQLALRAWWRATGVVIAEIVEEEFAGATATYQAWAMAYRAIGKERLALMAGQSTLALGTGASEGAGLAVIEGEIVKEAGFFARFWAFVAGGFSALWGFILGGWSTLTGVVVTAFEAIGITITAATAGWIIAAVAALTVLVVMFRKQLGDLGRWIVRVFQAAWRAVPSAMVTAFRAMISIVASSVRKIRELLSYLNPFAKHSPSLVDSVKAGTQEIGKHYDDVSNQAPSTARSVATAHRTLSSAASTASPGANTAAPTNAATQATNQYDVALRQLQSTMSAASATSSQWQNELTRAKATEDQFTAATRNATAAFQAAETAKMKEDILPFAPGAGDEIDALVASITRLRSIENQLTVDIQRQEAVVSSWEAELDSANATLDAASARLQELQDKASAARDALSTAKDQLSELARTPIQGMKAMSDQIFSTSMNVKQLQLQISQADDLGSTLNEGIYQNALAQKRLQLEILRTQNEVGMSADEARDKLSKLQGEIEGLQAQATDLRLAGAGSDILAPFMQQIDALKSQQQAIRGISDPVQGLQDQLNELQRQGQIMDLERDLSLAPLNRELDILQQKASNLDLANSLKFDPLTRQIDDLVNGMQEMPFDQLIQQIRDAQLQISNLTQASSNADAAVNAQQAVVDAVKARRDAIQSALDAEKAELDTVKDAYSQVNDQIQSMEQKLNDLAGSAKQALAAAAADASAIADAFNAAEGANFDDVTGSGAQFNDPGTLEDIDKLAADWEREMQRAFGDLDMFKPLKDAIKGIPKWLMKNWPVIVGVIVGVIASFFIGPLGPVLGAALGGGLGKAVDWLVRKIGPILAPIFGAIGRFFAGAGSAIADAAGATWNFLITTFHQVADVLAVVLIPVIKTLQTVFEQVFGVIGTVMSVLWSIIQPIISMLVNVFQAILPPALGILQTVFTTVWNAISTVLTTVWGILEPIFATIATVIGVIVVGALKVYFAIWKEVFQAVGDVLGFVWNQVLKPIFDAFQWIISNVLPVAFGIFEVAFLVVWKATQAYINVWWAAVKFVFDAVVWFIHNILGPVFSWLYDTIIQPVMGLIGAAISIVWNTVLKPIFDAINWVLRNVVGPVFSWLYSNIVKPAWDSIGGVISTVWNNIKTILTGIKIFFEQVVAPAFDWLVSKIGKVWDTIKSAAESAWGGITGVIRAAINTGIDIINSLVGAVNWVSEKLHIGVHIDPLPKIGSGGGSSGGGGGFRQLATGGAIPTATVGSGFITPGARAIVGEGSKIHPEYVIPTDPQYRNRAGQLWELLTQDLFGGGSGAKPGRGFAGGLAFGGWIPNPIQIGKDLLGGAADVAKGAVQQAIRIGVAPAFAVADQLLKHIPIPLIKGALSKLKDDVYNWITGRGNEADAAAEKWKAAQAAQAPQGGGGGGTPAPGTWRSITAILDAAGVPYIVTSTTGGHHVAGSKHYQGKAVDLAQSANGMMRIFNTLAHGKGLDEVFYDPAGWYVDRGQVRQGQIGGHSDHVHAATFRRGGILALADGGIVRTASSAIVGEAGPEVVAPLDKLLEPLTTGFRDVVNVIRVFDTNEALRAARLETTMMGDNQKIIDSVVLLGNVVNEAAKSITDSLGDAIEGITDQIDSMNTRIDDLSASVAALQQSGSSGGGGGSNFGYGTFSPIFLGNSPSPGSTGGLVSSIFGAAGRLPPGVSIIRRAAQGAVVRATSKGSYVHAGEGGRDEAIIPLPKRWDADSLGKKEYNFHGNLVFPNVKNGDDAEAFIRNLENLVD